MKYCKGLLFVFLFFVLYGCGKSAETYPYAELSVKDFDSLRNESYVINPRAVQWYIDSIRLASKDTAFVDFYVNRYYAGRNPYIWIDMRGADGRVDTLARQLSGVESEAIKSRTVFVGRITEAIEQLRNFDFTTAGNINLTLATLEYFSTKALARYVSGMQFGFVNPKKFMNRLEKEDPEDSLCKEYRVLYAVPTDVCDEKFLDGLIGSAVDGSFAEKMRGAYCKNKKYLRLREEYAKNDLNLEQRRKLAVNMERLRWETERDVPKYVWVNVPDFMLRAADKAGNASLQMRVCVGSRRHKTPLLTSEIKRLELNPEWTVPQSIIRKEISVRHAEDEEYFERNQMRIIDKGTGEEVLPADITADMLISGNYRVVQRKGEGNSLGRMIFRFDNDFAIYLHDTPNRQTFGSSQRAVSHGCVRVENPLELAVFLLDDKDPVLIDKIRMAIDLPPVTDEGKEFAKKEGLKHIGLKTFKPEIPLFITYYTAYPDEDGSIVYTSDPYEYDEKIYKLLDSY